MKFIESKTKRMKEVESSFGIELEELLRRLAVNEGLNALQISQRIHVHYDYTRRWLEMSGVYSSKLGLFDN
jgi:hypothetical protein